MHETMMHETMMHETPTNNLLRRIRLCWILAALTAATGAHALETVYIVRHADKVTYWPAERSLNAFRPLSRAGIDRAERLAEELAGAGVAAVYSSATTRTLATGMPLAEAAEISIGADDRSIQPTQLQAFFDDLRQTHAEDAAVLIVGHSNTVPHLLFHLGAEESCFERLDIADHDGDWLIHGNQGLWRVDLGTVGCDGIERLRVELERPAAAAEPSDETRKRTNVDARGLALQGYDAVAYLEDLKAVKGRPELATTHEGATYHFATPEHLAAFQSEPEKYLPQFGGWCAYGFGVDAEATGFQPGRYPVDPESFKVEDGKLYLFYNTDKFDALEHWNGDRPAAEARSVKMWAELMAQ